MDCHRGQSSGHSRVGYGISPLGGVTINPTIMPPELTQDWETDSWRAQTKSCVCQALEKGTVTPQETDPDLPVSVQQSAAEVWVRDGLQQGWGH